VVAAVGAHGKPITSRSKLAALKAKLSAAGDSRAARLCSVAQVKQHLKAHGALVRAAAGSFLELEVTEL
jgi:hypothetical protein